MPDSLRSRAPSAALALAGLSLAALLVGLAVDAIAAHGLSARWQSNHGGELVDVARTTEHRAQFPTGYRALSRIVERWDYERYGIPDTLPSFRATLDATLSNDRPIYFRARSRNRVTVRLDGRPITAAERIPEGDHHIRVLWEARIIIAPRATSNVDLFLEESRDGALFEPIAHGTLRPRYGHADRFSGALVVFFVFLLLATPTTIGMLSAPRGRARWLGGAAFLAILILALGFRLFDYAVMPHFRENGDELFATWNGYSLITEGQTRGWSLWASYYSSGVHHEALRYWTTEGGGWHLIQPYFEHPPLSHVLVGVAAWLGGATHYAHAPLSHTRLVPILLSLVTMTLMFVIGRRLSPRSAGPWLGVLLYAVLPMIAIQNRAIKEEMLLTPMLLGALYLFLRWRDGARDRWLYLAAFIAGLTALAKVSGAVLVPAIVLMVMSTGRYRQAAFAFGAGLLGIGLLFVYGAAIDWDVFITTTLKQATGRPAHWNLFPRFFADGLIIHNLVGHGPTLFLWLGYAGFLGARGRRVDPAWVILPLVYLVSMCVSAGNWMFGWYILPIYPFLCLASGEMLAELFKRPNPLLGLTFVGLLVLYGMNFTDTPEYFKQGQTWPRIRAYLSVFIVITMGSYFAAHATRWPALERLSRGVTAACLALVVVLGGYFIVHYDTVFDTHHDFDRDDFFDR